MWLNQLIYTIIQPFQMYYANFIKLNVEISDNFNYNQLDPPFQMYYANCIKLNIEISNNFKPEFHCFIFNSRDGTPSE